MSIQEISISNNQKKSLIKAIKKGSILFEDDNGDLVLNVEAYLNYKQEHNKDPLGELDYELDLDMEFIVFNV